MLKLQKLRLEVSGQLIDLDISAAVAESQSANAKSTSKSIETISAPIQTSTAVPFGALGSSIRPNPNPGVNSSGKTSPRISHSRSSQFGKIFKAFSFHSRRESVNSLKSLESAASLVDIVSESPATNAFGYIRADSSITRDKVRFLITETQRKLEIEEEVKEGAQKMMEATTTIHNMPESKGLKAELSTKIAECTDKIFIFQKALTHFQSLDLEFFGTFASNLF
jgi:hypothetical protein